MCTAEALDRLAHLCGVIIRSDPSPGTQAAGGAGTYCVLINTPGDCRLVTLARFMKWRNSHAGGNNTQAVMCACMHVSAVSSSTSSGPGTLGLSNRVLCDVWMAMLLQERSTSPARLSVKQTSSCMMRVAQLLAAGCVATAAKLAACSGDVRLAALIVQVLILPGQIIINNSSCSLYVSLELRVPYKPVPMA